MASSPLDPPATDLGLPAPGTGVDSATVFRLASTMETPGVLATVLQARGSVPQIRGAVLLVGGPNYASCCTLAAASCSCSAARSPSSRRICT